MSVRVCYPADELGIWLFDELGGIHRFPVGLPPPARQCADGKNHRPSDEVVGRNPLAALHCLLHNRTSETC